MSLIHHNILLLLLLLLLNKGRLRRDHEGQELE